MLNISDYNVKTFGSGLPILMLHGFQLDHVSMMAACEPVLRDKAFKRIYIDLPGMGMNSNTEGIHTADDMISAIVTLIQQVIGDEPFAIVGMSYGGYLARGVASRLMDQCAGLFLFAPVVFPKFADRTVPVHEVVFEDIAYTSTLDSDSLTALREMNVVITQRIAERQVAEFDEAVARADEAFLERYQANGYQASFDVDSEACTFNQPVMILAGKQDSIVGYEDQFRLSQKYKRSTYVALDGAGHGLHCDKEFVFNGLFEGWLSEVAATYTKESKSI